MIETFDGSTDVLRLAETPDRGTVYVTDLNRPDLAVHVSVRGRNVRRRSGYFGRGRGRWQVDYLPKNDTAHDQEA